ncbi:RNA polymerase subunit sigma [Rhizobium laguerreae]|jgi:RNA polymerase sigma factor (sigma-70 family)|uniref:RNA polymerase sigma-70 factor (ECF subfamily) n=1 Tax=Rhizobium laguerreae TaxID=1076926 RepID=A0ABR6GLI6_9HYPH|nr:sigma factor [Rhizobium laguerreae]MBB3166353.1 RNA polymerase sigma-70 factor (ECF subfamily) [Rhizobium laguerreae]NKM20992.1 RNA polymerase subunit sigma [Rhizobium laguerreae]NNH85608.1 RNA polymerase subunit sigma [Rhizobium laguerreae]OOO42802.1 RNA polymerase subunit sigma [Rhizobium laguerreae]
MTNLAREKEWASWLRSAIAGDSHAYHKFLTALTPHLRVMARRHCAQFGSPATEAEDVVQEVLLIIHLKRGTWDPSRPLGPWLSTIIRNKVSDSLRRRGKQAVSLEDVIATLKTDDRNTVSDPIDIDRILGTLTDPQRGRNRRRRPPAPSFEDDER